MKSENMGNINQVHFFKEKKTQEWNSHPYGIISLLKKSLTWPTLFKKGLDSLK